MGGINIASQLLGSAKGHQINVSVDKVVDVIPDTLTSALEKMGADFAKSEAAQFLTTQGYPATLEGVAEFLDKKLDAAIDSSSLSTQAKTDIIAVLDNLFAMIKPNIPEVTL